MADPGYTVVWSEDVAMIDCGCGVKEIILSEGDPKTCDCGRVYRYVCRFEVTEPEAGNQREAGSDATD